ncbi:MAG: hypothetical protein RIS35_3661, partial [Pseudomonadota bacterium]
MAVYTKTFTATTNNDSKTIDEPNSVDQWEYTYDGLGGTDSLSFDRLPQSDFTIYQDADGIHVDSVASASHNIYVTVNNVETLKFGDGENSNKTTVNLLTYFGDAVPPTVSSFNPADEATGVAVGANIVVTFSEAVSKGTGLVTLRTASGTVENFDVANSAKITGWGGATLTINPTNDLSGNTVYYVDIASTAVKDAAGNAYAGTTTYNFRTVAVNTSPTLATPIPDQAANEDSAFGFQFASGTFTDVDAGNAFTYTASRADGSALPAWLVFTPATRTFSGTPANGDVGAVSVKVTATDSAGSTVTDTFSITVANVNDAPTLAAPIVDQAATEDTA